MAVLVNNAGIMCSGPSLTQPMADISRQFEADVIGLVAATQALPPLLGAHGGKEIAKAEAPGRIVNISAVGRRVARLFVAGSQALSTASRCGG